jgi:uncharacterized membrane protein (DUF2068 family)
VPQRVTLGLGYQSTFVGYLRGVAGPRDATVVVIGAFKLAKGLGLLALGLGLPRLVRHDVADVLARWTTQLHIDPDGRHLGRTVQALAALDERRLTAITAGLCVYSAVFLTEGIGLLLRKRWAECFTVIVTGSFIPFELYELARHPGGIRVAVVLINVAIVWYLAWRLRRSA